MGNRFASAKNSIAICDRCGQQYKLTALRTEIIKTKQYNLLVCNECWDPDHPQLQLGMYPVYDPQAVRNPRKDNTYVVGGTNNAGYVTDGSRQFQWGWNPVGGSRAYDDGLTPNNLTVRATVSDVTIATD